LTQTPVIEPVAAPAIEAVATDEEAAPKKRGRAKKADSTVEPAVEPAAAEEKPKRGRGKKPAVEALDITPSEPVAVAAPTPAPAPLAVAPPPPPPQPEPVIEPEVEDPNRPKRTGWWAKAKKAMGGE
jgi:ribonuclease E